MEFYPFDCHMVCVATDKTLSVITWWHIVASTVMHQHPGFRHLVDVLQISVHRRSDVIGPAGTVD